MKMPVLETERLRIRPFVSADLPACDQLFRAVWEEGATPNWMEWASRNSEELANLYQPPYGDRALTLKEGDTLIGSVGLVPAFGPFGLLPGFDVEPDSTAARRNTPEFGLFWMLAPEYRGQGYATEAGLALIGFAFRELNLRRIVATTEYENASSIAVMRRLGMQIVRNPHAEPAWFQVVGVRENMGETE
jgi:ribosomal-protein-alanine N-acetyltransferase